MPDPKVFYEVDKDTKRVRHIVQVPPWKPDPPQPPLGSQTRIVRMQYEDRILPHDLNREFYPELDESQIPSLPEVADDTADSRRKLVFTKRRPVKPPDPNDPNKDYVNPITLGDIRLM